MDAEVEEIVTSVSQVLTGLADVMGGCPEVIDLGADATVRIRGKGLCAMVIVCRSSETVPVVVTGDAVGAMRRASKDPQEIAMALREALAGAGSKSAWDMSARPLDDGTWSVDVRSAGTCTRHILSADAVGMLYRTICDEDMGEDGL